MLITVKNVIEK